MLLKNFINGFMIIFSFGVSVPMIEKTRPDISKYWLKTTDYIKGALYAETKTSKST